MYSSNAPNLLGYRRSKETMLITYSAGSLSLQAEKQQTKLLISNTSLYPNFEKLRHTRSHINGFYNSRFYKKGHSQLVNSQTDSFNIFPHETEKISFKRLNIINLLAQTNSNFYNTQPKQEKIENDDLNSLNSRNGMAQKDSLVQSIERTGQTPNFTTLKPSYFFRYSRVNEYKKLGVELASPDKIRKWAERLLPTGRIVGLVLNANTLHHKTLKPLKGGLFCERIFGPTKDFRCACGKTITKRTRMQNTTYSAGLINLLTPTSKPLKRFFCKMCEVEYTWALTRRYQLGYISLAFPVTHLWYTKGFSSPISLLLDIHKYDLDSIIYCSQTTSLEKSYEITEMGISLKASQVLSFVRKNTNFTFKSNTTLLQDVRNKNEALIQARLRKRKKAVEKRKVLNNSRHVDTLTKDICDFETFQQTLKETQRSIQLTSLPTSIKGFCSSDKQSRFLSKRDDYLFFRTNHNSWGRSLKENQVSKKDCSEEKEPASILLQSLILPLIVTYSTQFFAPFVSWLLSFETMPKRSSQMSQNLVSTTLLQNIFTETFSVESGTQKELNAVPEITQILAQFKMIFTESLDSLEHLPDIIERQYHKALLDSRMNIQMLPVQTFGQINKYFYKQSYTVSIRQTKKLLKNLKSTSRQTFVDRSSFLVNSSNQVEGEKIYAKESKQTPSSTSSVTEDRQIRDERNFKPPASSLTKVSYFLNQLKEVLAKPQKSIASEGLDPTQINILEATAKNVQLKEFALHFFLYKLKKHQAVRDCTNNQKNVFELPYLTTKNSNALHLLHSNSGSLLLKTNLTNKPTLSFYYNLYGIADDHLWDNINDWNLVKSYITIYPDVMDQVIPAYTHRIPSSNMTDFAKNQVIQDTTFLVQQYKKLPKKYVYGYLQPLVNSVNPQLVKALTNTVNIDKAFDLYEKSVKNHQALPIKSTGAGILNNLINSITFVELQAMDKHFSFLLKESRKTILTYKTKIKPAGSKYTLPVLDNRGLRPNDHIYNDPTEALFAEFSSTKSIAAKSRPSDPVTKPYLLSSNMSVQSQTRYPARSDVRVLDTRKRIPPTSRSDRYAGIDKFMEKHHDLLRRAKIVRKFAITNVLPKAMILKVLPVLPPELRPIMKMADQIATSDLNRLYQRVLYRNERLNKIVLQLSESVPFGMTSGIFDMQNSLSTGNDIASNNFKTTDSRKKQLTEYETRPTNELFETPLFGYEKHYAQRLLQEAVDNLIDNGRAGANTEKDAKGRALKSLSEALKGKQGRFRQYLLGKRVDYSGRSVIVVGPKLKIHECGLPREMAVELYLPFIIQYLIQMKYTKTVVGAKTLIAREKEFINSILENVVRGHPIILNRAPTLHRLGFQAFQPILVEGRAILLHPMACTAFNADFDGDQMAVHIPITIEARSEAWRLMLARNNLLSPATGEPIILPSQDMVLGCYYLTTTRKMKYEQLITSNQYFSDVETVLYLYYLGKLHLHTPIWVKTHKTVVTDSTKKPLEIRISVYGAIQEIYLNTEYYYDPQGKLVHQYIRTTPGRILFNLIIKNST